MCEVICRNAFRKQCYAECLFKHEGVNNKKIKKWYLICHLWAGNVNVAKNVIFCGKLWHNNTITSFLQYINKCRCTLTLVCKHLQSLLDFSLIALASIKASCNLWTVSYTKGLTYKLVREEDAKIQSECSGCHKNLEEPSLWTSWHQRLIESPLLQVLVIGFQKTQVLSQRLSQRSTHLKDWSLTIILKSDLSYLYISFFAFFFWHCSCT